MFWLLFLPLAPALAGCGAPSKPVALGKIPVKASNPAPEAVSLKPGQLSKLLRGSDMDAEVILGTPTRTWDDPAPKGGTLYYWGVRPFKAVIWRHRNGLVGELGLSVTPGETWKTTLSRLGVKADGVAAKAKKDSTSLRRIHGVPSDFDCFWGKDGIDFSSRSHGQPKA